MEVLILLISILTFCVLFLYLLKASNQIHDLEERVSTVYKDMDNLIAELTKKEINDELSRTRLELMMLIKHFPNNNEDINKLAHKYFVELDGDSYMYKLYLDWIHEYNNNSIEEYFKKIMSEEEGKCFK